MAEKDDWEVQKKNAEQALDFWITFIGVVDADGKPLADGCKECLMCIIRLISFVESRHGTKGNNQPKRDPMQSGNPKDAWWKELRRKKSSAKKTTKKKDKSSVITTGKGKQNLKALEVPGAVAADPNVPKGVTPLPKKGHDEKSFTPEMSYFWGILLLLHRLSKKTFELKDCSGKNLIAAAVKYNGGGDKDYEEKIRAAAKKIQCCGELPKANEKKEGK